MKLSRLIALFLFLSSLSLTAADSTPSTSSRPKETELEFGIRTGKFSVVNRELMNGESVTEAHRALARKNKRDKLLSLFDDWKYVKAVMEQDWETFQELLEDTSDGSPADKDRMFLVIKALSRSLPNLSGILEHSKPDHCVHKHVHFFLLDEGVISLGEEEKQGSGVYLRTSDNCSHFFPLKTLQKERPWLEILKKEGRENTPIYVDYNDKGEVSEIKLSGIVAKLEGRYFIRGEFLFVEEGLNLNLPALHSLPCRWDGCLGKRVAFRVVKKGRAHYASALSLLPPDPLKQRTRNGQHVGHLKILPFGKKESYGVTHPFTGKTFRFHMKEGEKYTPFQWVGFTH